VTDASSLMQPQYAGASKTVRDSMRVIAKTEKTPHIPISVSRRISETCAAEIADLLIDMSSGTEGQQALSHNRFSGFRKARSEEYDRMRDLFSAQKKDAGNE
jgi:ABC-type phosphate/phosphonate transport system substrate-binding protein